MVCEERLGSVKDEAYQGRLVDYVEFDWHEAHKKLHRKVSRDGKEIGIRLGDWVLSRGLREGDVLGETEEGKLLVVHLLPADTLVIQIDPGHLSMLARTAYEVGNTHGALFYGDGEYELLTPYTEPMFKLLSGLHGVTLKREERVLDFGRAISSADHGHHHH